MKIIFDLDYTLLDTKKLKAGLGEIFNKENFSRDYQAHFKKPGVNFNSEAYLALLKGQKRIDEEREKELRLKLNDWLKHLDSFLFKETEDVLKHFKKMGAQLVLITFGDKKWHEEKIKNLSIKKYFDKIIFEDKDKRCCEFLRILNKTGEEVLIINDNAEETLKMVKAVGKNAKVFLIQGPYANNINHSWQTYSLNELMSLI